MATDAAPVVVPALVDIGLACELGFVVPAVFEFDAELFCVNDVWAVEPAPPAPGDVTAAAFCMLGPCALKAERKVPKNGLLVVGMVDM